MSVSEGTTLEMTELILMEKEQQAKLDAVEAALEEPERKLARAKELLLKAKAAYEHCLDNVKPLRSDKILIEGELEMLAGKKSVLRQEAAIEHAGGGVRPGTAAFVEQLDEIAGDKGAYEAKKAAQSLDVEAALADLKSSMSDD